jgi:hypothetical protein
MPVSHKRIHTGFAFAVGGRELIPDIRELATDGNNGQEPTVLLMYEQDGSDIDVFLLDDEARRKLAQMLAGGVQIASPEALRNIAPG